MKNRKSSCKQDETYGVIALRIILYLGLFILFIIIPIFCCKYHPKARYLRRKWSKVSEDPNSTKNTINEQNIEDLVGVYCSGGDFEENGVCGVSGGDRDKNPGLTGDYGSGVYGGNYRSGNEIDSSVYGEGGNSKIDGNSGDNGITGIRY